MVSAKQWMRKITAVLKYSGLLRTTNFMINAPRGDRGTTCQSGGFIKVILLIVIALVVLGFFGYDIREVFNSPAVRDNLAYAWDMLIRLWNTFLAEPALWLWDKITELLGKS